MATVYEVWNKMDWKGMASALEVGRLEGVAILYALLVAGGLDHEDAFSEAQRLYDKYAPKKPEQP